MELIKKQMPKDYVLVDSSDYHYGSLNCSRDKIKEMIDKVATKKNYFLLNKGDSIEAILPTDIRYTSCSVDIKENLLSPIQQADAVVKDFSPIKNKIIAWGFGNHEYKLLNTMDFGRYIAAQLNVPYGTYAYKFTAVDNKDKIMHKMFLTHGFGNISSNAKDDIMKLANKKASLKNKLCKSGFSDCIYMSCGHCFSSDTEIFTKQGWKTYDKLMLEDEVITINMKTELAEWNKINQIHIHENKFETMIQCQTDKVDFAVTDGHRIVYKHGVERGLSECYAKDFVNRSISFLPVSAYSNAEQLNEYDISDEELKLCGWLVSEGHFRKNGAIQLFQGHKKSHMIETVLTNLNIKFSKYIKELSGIEFECPHSGKKYKTKQTMSNFYITINDSVDILKYQPSKKIQDWVYKLSDRQFDIFLDTLILGDGNRPKQSKTSARYYSKDKDSIDTLQALCNIHGYRAYIGRVKNDNYELGISKQQYATISKQHSNNKNRGKQIFSEIKATSIVWCPSVNNGTVLVRRNGKSCFIGNTHQLLIVEPTVEDKLYLTDDGVGIKQHYHVLTEQNLEYIPDGSRWYGCSGSFLKLYSSPGSYAINYAEVAGYEPSEIGWLEIHVENGNVVKVEKIIP